MTANSVPRVPIRINMMQEEGRRRETATAPRTHRAIAT